jgi:hypothetical protein
MPERKNEAVKPTSEKDRRPSGTGTRDAVETAGDLSKESGDVTWEKQVKQAKRITRWTEDVRPSRASP